MLPPGVFTSTGTEIAYSLSSIMNSIGSLRFDAEFSDSQNSPWLVVPSPRGNVHHFVAVEADIFELAIVASDLFGGPGMAVEIASRFGAAYRL